MAGYEAVQRLIAPTAVTNLGALAAAGALGFAGNWIAAIIRSRAGRRLDSPALSADGAHARTGALDRLVDQAVRVGVAVAMGV